MLLSVRRPESIGKNNPKKFQYYLGLGATVKKGAFHCPDGNRIPDRPAHSLITTFDIQRTVHRDIFL